MPPAESLEDASAHRHVVRTAEVDQRLVAFQQESVLARLVVLQRHPRLRGRRIFPHVDRRIVYPKLDHHHIRIVRPHIFLETRSAVVRVVTANSRIDHSDTRNLLRQNLRIDFQLSPRGEIISFFRQNSLFLTELLPTLDFLRQQKHSP